MQNVRDGINGITFEYDREELRRSTRLYAAVIAGLSPKWRRLSLAKHSLILQNGTEKQLRLVTAISERKNKFFCRP